jgi:hypothetical protein
LGKVVFGDMRNFPLNSDRDYLRIVIERSLQRRAGESDLAVARRIEGYLGNVGVPQTKSLYAALRRSE